MSDEPPSQKTWGGRFTGQSSELMQRINASISFDKRLWRADIAGSKAHAAMLRDQNIISAEDAEAILKGLEQIADEFERDGVPERVELEDIHMTVEHRLTELIGPAAGRLHTARSRNDQVATDFRMWVRNACVEAAASIRELQRVLVEVAEQHAETVMPGFTHLQVAQHRRMRLRSGDVLPPQPLVEADRSVDPRHQVRRGAAEAAAPRLLDRRLIGHGLSPGACG